MNTEGSAALYGRARRVLVEGVSSGSRGPRNYDPYPPYMRDARGARMIDVDGNEYVDWQLAFGCVPLGHAHPRIVEVIREVAEGGSHLATALEVEVALAERLVAMLPGVERVRFSSTGTEACMTAVRMARGLTGRRKVLKFEGHYHGWYDGLLVSSNPQPLSALGSPDDPVRIPDSGGLTPGSLEDTVVAVWNDVAALERAFERHGSDLACVATEAVMGNMGVIPPKPGYLQHLQRLCREYGTLFWLDETCTGFRLGPGGAAEHYGLAPDILTYGKALGSGFPIAAIAGRDEIMAAIEPGRVLHFGTQNAPRLGLHVALAMLDEMTRDDGAGFRRLEEIGDTLTAGLNDVACTANGPRMIVQNVGSMFHPLFTERERIDDYRGFCEAVDLETYKRFTGLLRERGVWFTGNSVFHNLTCTAHSDADVERTVNAVGEALEAL